MGDDHSGRPDGGAVVASSVDAITVHGVDGEILHCNPSAERLYGIAAAEAVGRLVSDVLPRDAAARVVELVGRVCRGQEVGHEDTTWLLNDGTWVESSVSAITDDDGRVVGVSVAARDVTQRRRAESLLAGVSSILEMIAGAAPLNATLDALAETIERHAGTARCAILVAGNDGLCHGGGLRLPGVEDVPIQELVVDPASPEAVAAMVVADLASDPRWEAARETALRLELKTCWSSAIMTPGTKRVAGVFALYPGIYRPGDDDWSLVARLAHVAAIAIGRDRTMEHLAH